MKKQCTFLLGIFMMLIFLFPADIQAAETTQAPENTISILFSHDMHSHVQGGNQGGGFARMKTKIEEIKQTYPDSFLLDAGDFSMGTPYQTIFSSQASELRMMGALGYDATTLGNHEFDYRTEGLTHMLQAAAGSGDTVPALLCANIDWDRTLADPEKGEAAEKLQKACSIYGVKEYEVVEKNGIKAAVFGIIGKEADEFAPESGLFFQDPVEAARRVTETIRKEADADVIICLSHSGTWEDPAKSEDEILAKEVPAINVIISGHTHTELQEPILSGDTVIVSCGAYTKNLGHLTLQKETDGTYSFSGHQLIPLSSSIEENPEVLTQLETFSKLVDREYFSKYGYKMNQVLTQNTIEFTPVEEIGIVQGEEPLGNLMADAYLYAVKEPDVAIVPAGVVRASLDQGPVTVSEAFNMLSLGYGRDGHAGYPLVSAYLTGKELRAVAEVDATVSDSMPEARLYMAGLTYSYNSHRLFLNRAVDVDLTGGQELDDDRLYCVVTDLYSCQMLASVKKKSMGLLDIQPKKEDGTPIEDFEEHIVYDGSQELKAWYALASYLESFGEKGIPQKYSAPEGRKTEIDSISPIQLLKQPGKVMYLTAAAVLLLAAVLLIVILLVRSKRHKKGLPH